MLLVIDREAGAPTARVELNLCVGRLVMRVVRKYVSRIGRLLVGPQPVAIDAGMRWIDAFQFGECGFQAPKQVIEGSVLKHQHDHMLDRISYGRNSRGCGYRRL